MIYGAQEMGNFITATQSWVKNRINEVSEKIDTIKTDIISTVNGLIENIQNTRDELSEQISKLTDNLVVGKLSVDDVAMFNKDVVSNGHISCHGVTTTGPIISQSPAGFAIQTCKGNTGISANMLSLANERGKIAKLFLQGDQFFYDYPYDKIYTYYDESLDCKLQYLKRGSTPLDQIVQWAEEYTTDLERLNAIESWFNKENNMAGHPASRAFGANIYECYPATGAPFMIPESIYFRCPEPYNIEDIKLCDKNGNMIRVLRSFAGKNIKKLLINFPYVKTVAEESTDAGAAMNHARAVKKCECDESVMSNVTNPVVPLNIRHVGDFENSYYEVTDPDAVFSESVTSGLIPNVVLKINDFPKDEVSVIYFNVTKV